MKGEQGWRLTASAAAFLFPALSIAVANGYSVAAVFLLVGALAALPTWWNKPLEPRTVWGLVAAFLLMAAVWQVDGLRSHGGWRSVDKPIKFLIVLPCLFFLLRFPPRQAWLWAGIACGAVAAGLRALYEVLWLHLPRAEGAINAIQFGDLSLLLGLMSIVGLMMWRPPQRPRVWAVLLAAGAAMGLLGSLLSQARGGWLALVLLVPAMVAIKARFLDRRYLLISGLIALLLGAALVSLAARQLGERLERARLEVDVYETTGNAESSVGQRLAHWKAAWHMGLEKPLVGWSQQGYETEKKRMVAAGQVHPFVLKFSHAHNEFLDAFAKRGLVGLAALLLLYGVPLLIFWPRKSDDASAAAAAIAPLQLIGVLVPVGYIGFGLTQGFLGHNSGTMFFLFMTTLIFCAIQGERAAASAHVAR
ncbi:O-antigen ligase family protein [Variovorax sp. ZT4R33]|uniref:O-antigen ligase family protein n=1 Tax=Variovorax sp. ZT4R33 TaxID=3443743 RepID=UPI003F44D51E